MAATSSAVELCTLADAKLDAATSAKFFHDDDGAGAGAGAGAMSSSFSWPEAERTTSRFTSKIALLPLCEKYQVPADYIPISLDSGWVACRPPPEGSNAICVYVDALEAGMRIPLHDFYVAVLGHYSLAPSQLAPDAWRYMAAFVLLCKDAGVEPTLPAFLSFFSICTHKGDSVGWHHFTCRPCFKSRSGVTAGLFTAIKPTSDGWKFRFFHLRSPSTTPWPCAVKWGKPSRAAVRLPEVAWDDTVIRKLLERAGGSAIDVKEFLSRRSPPVAAATQDAPRDRVRLVFTPQQKHKVVKVVGAAAAAAGPPPPPQQELSRKRKSFSDTRTRGLVDCMAEASELAKKAMAELDEKRKELEAAGGEVARLKEQMRAVRDKHAGDVAQHKEVIAKLREEHAAAVDQMTERLNKEHADGVARLKEEHADGIARLKEKHAAEARRLADDKAARAAEVAKWLQGEHATAVARLKEEHADDVARVKDAANKEVQDAKKNIVLRLFPKLDASLLERPKLKGDLAAAAMQGTS